MKLKNYKSYKCKTEFGTYNLYPFRSKYFDNNSLAIILLDEDGEEFAVLTVNLEYSMATGKMAYVDTNNCPWAEKFIKENELGMPTEAMGFSGFCSYPLYIFDTDKIPEYPDEN